MARERDVWEVLFYSEKFAGPGGDGVHVRRFKAEKDARIFAGTVRAPYGDGTPEVQHARVSSRLFARWVREGQV